MKSGLLHIVLALVVQACCCVLPAQSDFQTIVTRGPVALGESFQVQYVLEDAGEDSEFFAPDFKEFRFVSGPNVYTGSAFGKSGPRKLKNIVYTLAATDVGKFLVPGASARIENRLYKSNSVWLQVISKDQARNRKIKPGQQVNEDIFLSPGEDAYAKIRRNLFMKVLVDKRTCFVGEPVTAIFKLYSRLDSKSDIVKNPGFYGFTVQDMINLDNKASSTETVNGKDFDVHIVRKVQLYPLQAGLFEVDAMEVRNKVRFSKSAVNKAPEQEIIEGIVPETDEGSDANSVVVENEMATETVTITVKPVPQKNKPLDFNGATGNFRITVLLKKNELAKNEECEMVVTVSGKGNFTQLSPPVVAWPEGIDGFEALTKDSLDHMQSPMSGKREFHFRFVSSKAGDYDMPAISFSFFNPDTNTYKTVQTQPTHFRVTQFEKPVEKIAEKTEGRVAASKNWLWLGALGLIGIAAILYSGKTRKKNQKKAETKVTPAPLLTVPAISELLQPAIVFAGADDKTFYGILRNCIWNFFTQRFDLSGSQVNKHSLSAAMKQKGIDENIRESILEILGQCETGVFTNVEGMGNKEKLLEETRSLLEKINSHRNR